MVEAQRAMTTSTGTLPLAITRAGSSEVPSGHGRLVTSRKKSFARLEPTLRRCWVPRSALRTWRRQSRRDAHARKRCVAIPLPSQSAALRTGAWSVPEGPFATRSRFGRSGGGHREALFVVEAHFVHRKTLRERAERLPSLPRSVGPRFCDTGGDGGPFEITTLNEPNSVEQLCGLAVTPTDVFVRYNGGYMTRSPRRRKAEDRQRRSPTRPAISLRRRTECRDSVGFGADRDPLRYSPGGGDGHGLGGLRATHRDLHLVYLADRAGQLDAAVGGRLHAQRATTSDVGQGSSLRSIAAARRAGALARARGLRPLRQSHARPLFLGPSQTRGAQDPCLRVRRTRQGFRRSVLPEHRRLSDRRCHLRSPRRGRHAHRARDGARRAEGDPGASRRGRSPASPTWKCSDSTRRSGPSCTSTSSVRTASSRATRRAS